jgi:hypothetical protein
MLYQHPTDRHVAAFVAALQFSASTSSTITTAIGHLAFSTSDPNSPVVASGAITNLQVAAGGAPSLPSLLLLHHPRHCCLNSLVNK